MTRSDKFRMAQHRLCKLRIVSQKDLDNFHEPDSPVLLGPALQTRQLAIERENSVSDFAGVVRDNHCLEAGEYCEVMEIR
jgi:hypothetical protein